MDYRSGWDKKCIRTSFVCSIHVVPIWTKTNVSERFGHVLNQVSDQIGPPVDLCVSPKSEVIF